MKDIISMDSKLEELYYSGFSKGKQEMGAFPYPISKEDALKLTKEDLHSLLISKLPEKKDLSAPFKSKPEHWKAELRERVIHNKVVDDMRKSIDELFGVQND